MLIDPLADADDAIPVANLELREWGRAHGWPELRIAPWAVVGAGERGWLRFTSVMGRPQDIALARVACGLDGAPQSG